MALVTPGSLTSSPSWACLFPSPKGGKPPPNSQALSPLGKSGGGPASRMDRPERGSEMKGPGMRYVRTIFTRDGNFTLTEHRSVPEEVISVEHDAEVGGWYVTVCGVGEAPKEG